MTVIQIRRFEEVEAFLGAARPFLEAREAEHNLLLSICARLAGDTDSSGGDPPYLAVVERDGEVAAVALRTPPFHLVLSMIDHPEVIGPLARRIHRDCGSLSGILGPTDAAGLFAAEWGALSEVSIEVELRERIFRAEQAIPPADVPGQLREARRDERELLIAWIDAFAAEAVPPDMPREDSAAFVDRGFAAGRSGFYIWEHSEAVSLAGAIGQTRHGIRVGPVYTPPERRGAGYASALVAAVTQRAFDEGKRFCFLFTDLANPTSNRIYQRIGYRPVCDVDQYAFKDQRRAR